MGLIDADALKKQIEDFHCKGCDNYNFVRCRACWVDDTITYLEEAPTIGGWISAKDRLPEDGQLVVVRHEVKGRIYAEVAHYIMNLWWLDWDSNGLELNAISWIPLPEPTEEVNEDD